MPKFSVEGEGGEGPSSPNKRKRIECGSSFDGEATIRQDSSDKESDSTISFKIDTDVLDCSICMEPLIAPVFQCENGHIACSSCCTKLENKCHSCCWPIGYSRCLAIEKVVESITIYCQNSHYGCKETVNYAQRHTHEETCIFAPCTCPISDCSFRGSSQQLFFHFSSKHWASTRRFQYNCPFTVSLDINESFLVLNGEDCHLFLLTNSLELLGNAVAVSCIEPSSPKGGFSYDLVTKKGGRSLRLQSFTECTKRMDPSLPMDFLLVPCDFHSCDGKLWLEVCIWSYRESECGIDGFHP